jgi:hypothetical protein
MEESRVHLKRVGDEPTAPASRLPEDYLPSDDELVALVRAQPLLSLRELAAKLWPALPWRPLTPSGDSVTEDLRVFPAGKGTKRQTTAEYLRDRMQDLVLQRRISFGPLRRDEADREAQVAYVCPGEPQSEVSHESDRY